MIKKLLMVSALACVSLLGATASAHPFDRLDHVSRPAEHAREHARPDRMQVAHHFERPSFDRPVAAPHGGILEMARHRGDMFQHVSRQGARHALTAGNGRSVNSIVAQRLNSRFQQRARCEEGTCMGNQHVTHRASSDTVAGRINLARPVQSHNGTGDTLHKMRVKIKNDMIKGVLRSIAGRHQHPGKEVAAKGTEYGAAMGFENNMAAGATRIAPLSASRGTIRSTLDNYRLSREKQLARDAKPTHVERSNTPDRHQ